MIVENQWHWTMKINTAWEKDIFIKNIEYTLFQNNNDTCNYHGNTQTVMVEVYYPLWPPPPLFTLTGGLYSTVGNRNIKKKSHIFEGCYFPWFYILIWSILRKIETKNFNSDPYFFNLVKPGTILPATPFLNCVHIGRSQATAAIIRWVSKFLLENSS